MASNSGVQQPAAAQQQHFQQAANSSPHHCKECGLYLNSAKSLEVHLQYHKENLLKHWAIQAAAASSHSSAEETNNNTTTTKAVVKREFIQNNTVAAADSSDAMHKKSPDYSRATPETAFGHPPTPQSYQSAASPYQQPDNSAFSPNFQGYQQQIKTEANSPHYQNNYSYQEQQQFFPLDANTQTQQPYAQQEYAMHKAAPSYRYHPYQQPQHSPYEQPAQVSSSSPAYPPQPTPSPSPKQCDKCGYVCESASQLIDHLNMAHPPTPAPHLSAYQSNQHFMFGNEPQIKTEEDPQSEILDLDSHKVHQVYQEEVKRENGDHNPHSVSAMLNSWSPPQQKMFQQQQYIAAEPKMYQPDQKLFQPHQMHGSQEFLGNGVTTTTQDAVESSQAFRPFEHLPSPPVISSTQVPTNPQQQTQSPVAPTTKAANWKSNEARRPKTYNCTACNKWFTSSGHLKRHYNTTLHKNAVKTSGQPDPASLPISAHHHPARESSSNKEQDLSGSPGEESRGEDTNSMPSSQFERLNAMPPGLLQQPPNGPYDRQPAPNIHHTPPLHSPMHNPNPSITNLSNGSPPNGDAGPSTNNIDSRGLLSLSTHQHNTASNTPHGGYNTTTMVPPVSAMMATMENQQFQMYPNGSAPHVTQVMAINNLNTTGEYHHQQYENQGITPDNQPLPSFAQFQAHRYGVLVGYGNANVGGEGLATAPYTTYYTEAYDTTYRTNNDDDYKLTVLTAAEPTSLQCDNMMVYNNNNNNNDLLTMATSDVENKMHALDEIKLRLEVQPASPEKARIKRDYEESTGSPLITSTVVTKPGIHKCFDCDKVFNKACYLTQHNKTFHSGDKPFKCTRCGKRFSSETSYQEHAPKHAGEKPHKCDLCPKQFNHKTDLRRHMCLHTGQKPYACDTCGKGFIRKDHMLKHCETHARKTHAKAQAIR